MGLRPYVPENGRLVHPHVVGGRLTPMPFSYGPWSVWSPCCAQMTLAAWDVRVRSGVVPLQVGLVEGFAHGSAIRRMSGRCADSCLVRGLLAAEASGVEAPTALIHG